MANRRNKRAAISATLTWFTAFVIIFFMMILFLAGVGVLSKQKASSYVSASMAGSKSGALLDQYSEPSGYDSGDLELQRALAAFLNSESEFNGNKRQMKDAISNLGAEVYRKNSVMSASEIKGNPEYNKIYESATTFFDGMSSLYWPDGACYVLCLDFKEKLSTIGYEPMGSQVIVGNKCLYGGKDIYSRGNAYYRCAVSKYGISSKVFNYAYLELFPDENRMVRVRILQGGIKPIVLGGTA